MIYVNGINTDPLTHANTAQLVEDMVDSVATAAGLANVEVTSVYNQSMLYSQEGNELICAMSVAGNGLQLLGGRAWRTMFGFWLTPEAPGGSVGSTDQCGLRFGVFAPLLATPLAVPVADVTEAVVQMANVFRGGTAQSTATAKDLTDDILYEISRGRRVVVFAHSQGNLVTLESARMIDQFTRPALDCVASVNLAPPLVVGFPEGFRWGGYFARGNFLDDIVYELTHAISLSTVPRIVNARGRQLDSIALGQALRSTYAGDRSDFLALTETTDDAESDLEISRAMRRVPRFFAAEVELHSVDVSYLGSAETRQPAAALLAARLLDLAPESCHKDLTTGADLSALPPSIVLEVGDSMPLPIRRSTLASQRTRVRWEAHGDSSFVVSGSTEADTLLRTLYGKHPGVGTVLATNGISSRTLLVSIIAPVDSIVVAPYALTLVVGATAPLAAAAPGAGSHSPFSWRVADTTVISYDGMAATAIRVGSTDVAFSTNRGVSATAHVTVVPDSVASVLPDSARILSPLGVMHVGIPQLLRYVGFSGQDSRTWFSKLTEYSSDSSIVAVDEWGTLVPVAAGQATVGLKWTDNSGQSHIMTSGTITVVPLARLALTLLDNEYFVGDSATAAVTAIYADGMQYSRAFASYTHTGSALGVLGGGRIVALASGVDTLVATWLGMAVSEGVGVREMPAVTFAGVHAGRPITIYVGDTLSITPLATAKDTAALRRRVVLASADTDVTRILDGGLVVANHIGRALIRVSIPGATTNVYVDVENRVVLAELLVGDSIVAPGQVVHVCGVGYGLDGAPVVPPQFIWSVQPAFGVVLSRDASSNDRQCVGALADSLGAYTVTGVDDHGIASRRLFVVAPESISVLQQNGFRMVVGTFALSHAKVLDAQGRVIPNAFPVVTSADSSVAWEDDWGDVLAVREGSTTLTYTYQGVSRVVPIQVRRPAASMSLHVPVLYPGDSASPVISVLDDQGRVLNEPVLLTSDDTNIVRISRAGQLYGVSSGEATVHALIDTIMDTVRVTVFHPWDRIVIHVRRDTLLVGTHEPFAATGYLQTGDTAGTNEMSFRSSDSTILSFSGALATNNAPGQLIVTVSGGGIQATSNITTIVNGPPTAAFSVDTGPLTTDADVHFDGRLSTDPDNDALEYTWDFGDFQTATGSNAAHRFLFPGNYSVSLTVRDVWGQSGATVHTLAVTIAPPRMSFVHSTPARPDLDVAFDASASTPGYGTQLSAYAWSWGDGSVGGSGVGTTHAFASAGSYLVTLTGTDALGQTGSTSGQLVTTYRRLVTTAVSGSRQAATPGVPLTLVVLVKDSLGTPQTNIPVRWSLFSAAAGSVDSSVTHTDGNGFATARWTFGGSTAQETVAARPLGAADSALFVASGSQAVSRLQVFGGTASKLTANRDTAALWVVALNTFSDTIRNPAMSWAGTGSLRVSPTGRATCAGPSSGSSASTATATASSVSASVPLTCAAPGVVASATYTTVTVSIDTLQLSAVAADANGNPIPGAPTPTWTNSGGLVYLSVTPSGRATCSDALNGETSTAKASVPGFDPAYVTITCAYGSISIAQPSYTVLMPNVDAPVYAATAYNARSELLPNAHPTWSFSNGYVNGRVTAAGVASCTDGTVDGASSVASLQAAFPGTKPAFLNITCKLGTIVPTAPYTVLTPTIDNLQMSATVYNPRGGVVTGAAPTWAFGNGYSAGRITSGGIASCADGTASGTSSVTSFSVTYPGAALNTLNVTCKLGSVVIDQPATTSVRSYIDALQLTAKVYDARGNLLSSAGKTWTIGNGWAYMRLSSTGVVTCSDGTTSNYASNTASASRTGMVTGSITLYCRP